MIVARTTLNEGVDRSDQHPRPALEDYASDSLLSDFSDVEGATETLVSFADELSAIALLLLDDEPAMTGCNEGRPESASIFSLADGESGRQVYSPAPTG